MIQPECTIQGRQLPADRLAELRQFDGQLADHAAVSSEFAEQGYLLLRSVLDRAAVLAARSEVFTKLRDVGEIQSPASEGISTGTSRRAELYPDLGAFWSAVSEGQALRAVTHGDQLREVLSAVMDQPARPHDLMYVRPMPPGPGTRLHYDLPFFAGFSPSIHTAWVPLGDVAIEEGPLAVMERSHTFADLLEPISQHDYSSDRSNQTIQQAAYDAQSALHPIDLAEQREVRLLTAEFRAGDVLIFQMQLMHGSLDNRSPRERVRLSCDVRYQPAGDAWDDPRYFGSQPTGSKGGGYADMRGAQPLGSG
jgi:ectoine hydroxylase-related dioxygenase (phytanoyl-CoA dioxygenase family)